MYQWMQAIYGIKLSWPWARDNKKKRVCRTERQNFLKATETGILTHYPTKTHGGLASVWILSVCLCSIKVRHNLRKVDEAAYSIGWPRRNRTHPQRQDRPRYVTKGQPRRVFYHLHYSIGADFINNEGSFNENIWPTFHPIRKRHG